MHSANPTRSYRASGVSPIGELITGQAIRRSTRWYWVQPEVDSPEKHLLHASFEGWSCWRCFNVPVRFCSESTRKKSGQLVPKELSVSAAIACQEPGWRQADRWQVEYLELPWICTPSLSSGVRTGVRQPRMASSTFLVRGMSCELQTNDSAIDGYRDGVRAVVSLQFRKNAPDVALYGFLGER